MGLTENSKRPPPPFLELLSNGWRKDKIEIADLPPPNLSIIRLGAPTPGTWLVVKCACLSVIVLLTACQHVSNIKRFEMGLLALKKKKVPWDWLLSAHPPFHLGRDSSPAGEAAANFTTS